jgi:hypothetical protein
LVTEENPNPPDPCEVYLAHEADQGVKDLPSRMQVRFGESIYGTLLLQTLDVGGAK